MFNNLKTSISYAKIWAIAYPIIIGSVAQNVINVTDTIFLGQLGEIALGGGAIGGLFYLAIVMLGWGFGLGTQIVVARRFGEGTYRTIGRTVEHGFIFLMVLALVMFLLVQFFGNPLLIQIIESESVSETSVEFLNYRIFGIFFAHTNFIFRAFYVGIGRTRVITFTTLIMVSVNVFLDYSLIFGNFGFPAMGVGGAALASVISEVTCTLAFILYTSIRIPLSRYRLFSFKVFSIKLLLRLLRVSIPMMLQNFLSFSVWFIFFLIIEKMGESQLAISNVIRSIYIILLIPIMGFASATNTLVSFVIGQGKPHEVLATIAKISTICVLGVIMIVGTCSIIPEQIISIYTSDPNLIRMGVPILYVIFFSSVLFGVGFILFSGVSGTGKTQVSLIIEVSILSCYLVFAVTMVKIFHASVTTVWLAEILYGILLILSSLIYLRSKRWMGEKV